MRYSFDPVKRATNLRKHGLDLADARQIIEGAFSVTIEDQRYDYGEERFMTLGPLGGRLVVVITAESDDDVRVISMREATCDEKEGYRAAAG